MTTTELAATWMLIAVRRPCASTTSIHVTNYGHGVRVTESRSGWRPSSGRHSGAVELVALHPNEER
jgi:hypothetical protein